ALRLWRERFCERPEEVESLGFDEVFRRMWELYLAYSEAGFRTGYLDVHQLLLTRAEGAT
ncbi:class I SAM-dependent methyltransferase, partial [Kitasatospora sp. NPDC058263]